MTVRLAPQAVLVFPVILDAVTAVVAGYVQPRVSHYLGSLQTALAAAGVTAEPMITKSNGGVMTAEAGKSRCAQMLLSGTASGVIGACRVARMADVADALSLDVGGTSADVAVVRAGEPQYGVGEMIGDFPIYIPTVSVTSIGEGGGSIAWVDPHGVLKVGPESAGSNPGPACYGQGGAAPTVTDANLLLGYLDPGNFLGGRKRLDRDAAAASVAPLARSLGIEDIEAAAGIHRVVNTTMAEGIRLISVRRGVDPRRFALLAFGGAAGLHATELARQLSLTRVVGPRIASVLSAWGMLATDLRLEITRTHIGDTSTLDVAAINRLYRDMEAEGRDRLASWFDGAIHSIRSADMRYGEQIFEIDVPLDQIDFAAPDLLAQIKAAFERRHEALYTYSLADQDPVLINARVATIRALPALARPRARERTCPHPRGSGACSTEHFGFSDILENPTLRSGPLGPLGPVPEVP